MREFLSQFDRNATVWIQGRPAWLYMVMSFATRLGGPLALVSISLFSSLVAFMSGNKTIGVVLFAALIALGLNGVLKMVLRRARPDTLYVSKMRYKTFSFPSGHAFGSLVLYGLFAYMSSYYFAAPWDSVVVISLSGLVVLIGASRIYLGAHYLFDVLGGWMFGGLTLLLLINLTVAA